MGDTMSKLEYGTGTAVAFNVQYTNDNADLTGMDDAAIRAFVLNDAQLHLSDIIRATPTRPVLAGKDGRVYVGSPATPKAAPQAKKNTPAQAAPAAPAVSVAKTVAPQPADVEKLAHTLFTYGAYASLDAAREAVIAKQEEI